MPYVAKTDCFFASKHLPAGTFVKTGQVIPDDWIDPETLPEFVERVGEKPTTSAEAVPPKLSLGQLGESMNQPEGAETGIPGRGFKAKPPRGSDRANG